MLARVSTFRVETFAITDLIFPCSIAQILVYLQWYNRLCAMKGDLIPAGHARMTTDALAMRATGNATGHLHAHMDGHQLERWLTVQAGDMVGK